MLVLHCLTCQMENCSIDCLPTQQAIKVQPNAHWPALLHVVAFVPESLCQPSAASSEGLVETNPCHWTSWNICNHLLSVDGIG